MKIKINVVKEEIAVKIEAEIEKRGRIDEEKKIKKRSETRELGKILFIKNKNKIIKQKDGKIKAIKTIVKIIGIKSRN